MDTNEHESPGRRGEVNGARGKRTLNIERPTSEETGAGCPASGMGRDRGRMPRVRGGMLEAPHPAAVDSIYKTYFIYTSNTSFNIGLDKSGEWGICERL